MPKFYIELIWTSTVYVSGMCSGVDPITVTKKTFVQKRLDYMLKIC